MDKSQEQGYSSLLATYIGMSPPGPCKFFPASPGALEYLVFATSIIQRLLLLFTCYSVPSLSDPPIVAYDASLYF